MSAPRRTQIVRIGLAGHAILVDGFPVARIEPANVPGRPIVPLEDYLSAVEGLLAEITALRDLAGSRADDHGEWPELDKAPPGAPRGGLMFPPFNPWTLLLPSWVLVLLDRLDDARWRLHDAVDRLRAGRWGPARRNRRGTVAFLRRPCGCGEPAFAVHLDTGDVGVCRDCLRRHVGVLTGDRQAIDLDRVRSTADRAVPR